jgi:hypothetical protein
MIKRISAIYVVKILKKLDKIAEILICGILLNRYDGIFSNSIYNSYTIYQITTSSL